MSIVFSYNDAVWNDLQSELKDSDIFIMQCFASAVYVVVMCLSVCHKSELYQNTET